MNSRRMTGTLVALMITACVASVRADDWPQFRGPNRDGVSAEKGLLTEWPKDGPKKLWSVKNLGLGFGTPSVADGKIFGLGTRDGKDGIWALNESDGKELWFTPFDDPRKTNQNNGPSGTPTVEGGKAYALSSLGKVVCVDVKTGKADWQADLVKDFGGRVPSWGYSESPLVDGDKVIITPGGKNTLVALDKASGKALWKSAVPKSDARALLVGDRGRDWRPTAVRPVRVRGGGVGGRLRRGVPLAVQRPGERHCELFRPVVQRGQCVRRIRLRQRRRTGEGDEGWREVRRQAGLL